MCRSCHVTTADTRESAGTNLCSISLERVHLPTFPMGTSPRRAHTGSGLHVLMECSVGGRGAGQALTRGGIHSGSSGGGGKGGMSGAGVESSCPGARGSRRLDMASSSE